MTGRRRPALRWPLLVVAAGWGLTAALAALYHGQYRPAAVDRTLAEGPQRLLAAHPRLATLTGLVTDPRLIVTLVAVIALVACFRRRWATASLLLAGPVITVVLTDLALKPLIDRHYFGSYLCFPSGHTGGVVSVATVLVITAWRGGSRVLRAVTLALWPILTAAAALGLVGMHYHYPTDIAGGIGWSVGTVVLLALGIERARGVPGRVGLLSRRHAAAAARATAPPAAR